MIDKGGSNPHLLVSVAPIFTTAIVEFERRQTTMLEIDVPLSEFLILRALAASIRAKYLSFITIIARTADGEFLQDELLRHWESFDDLTGGEILLLSPRLTDHTYPATVKYWREPAGLVSQGLKFAECSE